MKTKKQKRAAAITPAGVLVSFWETTFFMELAKIVLDEGPAAAPIDALAQLRIATDRAFAKVEKTFEQS